MFDGLVTIDPDGLALSFDPNLPLPLRSSFTLEFDLEITDDLGVTRPFARSLPPATQAANGGFELGDFTDFEVQGDVDVVTSFGSLTAPEGNFMARLLTSDMAVEGRTSRLRDPVAEPGDGLMALVQLQGLLIRSRGVGSTGWIALVFTRVYNLPSPMS